MIFSLIGFILFVGLIGVSLLGGRLARHLPAEQLSADSKDAVKLAMGLIATMTAVLLGLLITSAKGTYDTEESEVMQMAAKVAFLDRVLKLYGPETADARRELRDAIADGVRRRTGQRAGAAVRRRPHGRLELALGVLRQPSDRGVRSAGHALGRSTRQAGADGPPDRLRGGLDAGTRTRVAADRADVVAHDPLLWL